MTVVPARYLRISEGEDLPPIRHFGPFRAVVILDDEYTNDWQDIVSRWMVDAGCLYMMAWGPNCSSWDDSVDYTQIQQYLPDEAPEQQFVMTTWHDDESLEEVFWFAQMCAYDPYDLITNTLMVHVGKREREREFQALFKRAESWADRQPDDTDLA